MAARFSCMLKALELYGFKSFADKTRFEFPAGITVVVGPNGSGKSNVVDAIKWVLGEQSAKSLRGKDMADVIFKGSGSGGRKMMNTAEATILFDNSDGKLAIDAPEVHVTRRVYRSGEGEYLINRQPCRLKDVRDLFRGTGVGTDAYSLIEQGKVDRLLQASAKDRRAIFEEAAGISRFKAKKIEAQRRLERVHQNLLRLRDIVDEVENRLKNVRTQASKARRYREYSDRLQQLRTQVALSDWRQLTEKLEAVEAQMAAVRTEIAEHNARGEHIEARTLELETEIATATETVRNCENQSARNREQIAALESTADHQRARCRDIEAEASRYRHQLLAMTTRAGDLQQRLAETRAALELADRVHADLGRQLHEHEAALQAVTEQVERQRAENDARRSRFVAESRRAAGIASQAASLDSQLAALVATRERNRQALAELAQVRAEQASLLEQAEQAERESARQLMEFDTQLEAARDELDESRHVLAGHRETLSAQQGRHSGVSERAAVLDELEERQEGLSAGVTRVLAQAREASSGPLQEIRGLVADLLGASVEDAPLVDAALGDRSQLIVVQGDELMDRLRLGKYRTPGRVGFVRLEDPGPPLNSMPATGDIGATGQLSPESPETESGIRADEPLDLTGQPGVLGRADRVVEAGAEFADLARRLLSDTWLVDRLARAIELHGRTGRRCRFVTSGGEIVERDGSIVVGPRRTSMGLVSRKSELRALRQERAVLEQRIQESHQEIARLQENIDQHEAEVRRIATHRGEVAVALADQRATTRTLRQRQQSLDQQAVSLEAELESAEQQQQTVGLQRDQTARELVGLEAALVEIERSVQDQDRHIEGLEAERHRCLQETTAARVELAKSEQHVSWLRGRVEQFEEDRRERSRSVEQASSQLATSQQRSRELEHSILVATSELAQLYLRKEDFVREIGRQLGQRTQREAERADVAKELQKLHKKLRGLEDAAHRHDLAAGTIRHERQSLAQRLRDDYGIELETLTQEMNAQASSERTQVDEEIADLRRKINSLGAVNMEALNELDELEGRFTSLSTQYQDLDQAKESLERIIQKINADSRRLFLETLDAIRVNFQALYRRAFGGGKADIVLEEGVDVLDAGVEIIATPPGKPSFNNSLLSGGEKALTAVALLLAIFQFRPSPFCVLDEVDAPFDEANIGRFVDVLKEFLGWTKFVIVTHSKKTMTAATTLYGITMQESGVSKQVSVRFEDVSDDGQISAEAVQRDAARNEEAA